MPQCRTGAHRIGQTRLKRSTHDDHPGAGIPQDVLVIIGSPQRVRRHRHGANLDGTKEGVDELGLVEQEEHDALFRADPQLIPECGAGAIDTLVECPVQ